VAPTETLSAITLILRPSGTIPNAPQGGSKEPQLVGSVCGSFLQ